ncbi:Thioredoxin domain-containing protein [uncultured Paludibacter sp.]|uniref:Thioredoxin domain-containing protein n=1 Tax=uncultured Paludibacter sp. TaxID=497635 RepID=A0A653AJL0_9BACT|nr:Thioredoxin domain-containing protein [uncultured Paludibacter sp.]
MKKTFLFALLVALSASLFSQGIIFEENHNLKDALAKAKTENKLIFIDAYASWCGPCKLMAKEIFPQKEVGDYYNAHFVNLKLDMEAPENLETAKKYDVKAYPTYLYLNPDGEVVHRALGSMPAEDFIKVAKTADDGENNAMAIMKKIKNGDRSLTTIKKYLELNPYDTTNSSLINEYFKSLSENEIYTQENWDLFNRYVNDINLDSYQYFLNNRDKIAGLVGKENVDNKILSTMVKACYQDSVKAENLRSIDPALFEKAKTSVQIDKAYSNFGKNKDDKTAWNNLMTLLTPYLNKENTKAQVLNNMAWMVYENYKKFNDKKALKNALNWSKKAIELAPDKDYVLDTYANILFALGKKKEAISAETKALELATKDNNSQSIESFKKTIEEFKK